ncbi:MAG: hypothetical protein KatS3mg131_0194 [Candidatus Tectimicrobiota bacterium]|nr:MAG: hypothetical protein KatS3mg131_0194 [Candidatus Tectomicrobia bacterium]
MGYLLLETLLRYKGQGEIEEKPNPRQGKVAWQHT